MKILAVDTTAKTATAAISENERLIALTILNTPNTHSVTLLPMIDGLLSCASLSIADMDILACAAGPGSFTGVRIGAATIKGLAYVDKKVCVGVSSLEALATNITEDGLICPVMDARRNQLYNALFRAEDGRLERLTPDRALSADELRAELENENGKIFVTGDGSDIALNALKGKNVVLPHETLRYHNAYGVALAAYKKYMQATEEERREFTPEKLSPAYLRMSQAERERLEREGKQK